MINAMNAAIGLHDVHLGTVRADLRLAMYVAIRNFSRSVKYVKSHVCVVPCSQLLLRRSFVDCIFHVFTDRISMWYYSSRLSKTFSRF